MAEWIDRQALIDHLNECLAEEYDRPYITDAVTIAIKCFVEQMPTVEPKREEKRGEWFGGEEMYLCSYCWGQVYIASDYCPNCGADMR